MSKGVKLSQKDIEALQHEWDVQDNSRAREKQIILDRLYHDKPKQETPTPESTSEPIIELEEGKWLKELPGTLVDDPVQKDVDTRNGPGTVANFRMTGDYGTIKVGLWNKQADEIMNYTEGTKIILTNIQVKPAYEGIQQIGGSRNTRIKEV